MRKIGIGIGLLLIGGFAACQLLLPEGFVIRGPMLQSMLGRGVPTPDAETVQGRFRVAPGYRLELFAQDLPNARVMRFSPGGELIVSQPRDGRLTLVLPDADGDGRSDGQRELIGGLDRPHGFDFHDGFLYVGETGSVARVPYRERGPGTITVEATPERIVQGLPPGGNHWSRTLRFGPDGGLYLHVGSSCNVCEEEDPRRATILRFAPDGSGEEIYAAGLRNSVGFDWQPGTNALYATDNGRDLLGDDYPPCELNRIERGHFYGWPYANGDNDPDPDFGPGNEARVEASTTPAHDFRAHNAPLGIHFLRHPATPPALRGAALVALHGSWNRSRLDGYKVVSLHWDERGEIHEEDFLTGFEVDEDVIGRPADVLQGPDGAIYVSDDYAGVIYRLRPGEASGAPPIPSPAVRPASATLTPDPALASLAPATRQDLEARGAALFAANACGTCHLADQAAPGVVAKPLEALGGKYTVASLTGFFLAPTPPMPVFDLPQEDRRALSVHLLGRFE
jgi:glucose/arabinose dehydrogenase